MKNNNSSLGIKLFYSNNPISSAEKIIKKAIETLDGLNKIYSIDPTTAKFLRSKKVNESNINHFLTLLKEKKTEDIFLDRCNNGQIEIDLDISFNEKFRNTIELIVSNNNEIKFDKILSFLKETILPVITLNYGIITIETDYNFTVHELSSSSPTWFAPGEDHDEKLWYPKFDKERRFYQQLNDKHDEFIRKAYWANFLNSTHIKKIGGIEKIKKECPVFLVEELSNKNVYIQLTEKIEDFGTNEYYKKLKILDNFLKPAKHPKSPNPIFK